jgi:hypothetical protein
MTPPIAATKLLQKAKLRDPNKQHFTISRHASPRGGFLSNV